MINRPRPNYLPTNDVESKSLPMRCTPSFLRRLLMRLHCSVTAVKNSRRFLTRRHHHCQRCSTAKLKVIADAPILQSCHSHWGGCCAVSPSQSCCSQFKEIANALPWSSSRRLHRKIKGDCWRTNIAVSPPLLRMFLHSLVIAASPPSRIRGEQKNVGGVGNDQSNRQIFGTSRRGSQTRN